MEGITRKGILCPSCGSPSSSVENTRKKLTCLWRRRKCDECGERISTIEMRVDLCAGNRSASQQMLDQLASQLSDDDLMAELRRRLARGGAA